MKVSFLTTIDNPYDPCDQFDQWYAFDMEKGYDTCGYLDKIAHTAPDLSNSDNRYYVESAIDEIVKFNVRGIYKKVVKDV